MLTYKSVFLLALILLGLLNFRFRNVLLPGSSSDEAPSHRKGLRQKSLLKTEPVLPTDSRLEADMNRGQDIIHPASIEDPSARSRISEDIASAFSRNADLGREEDADHGEEEDGVVGLRGDGCDDKRPQCRAWAQAGQCAQNAGFIIPTCRDSCGDCLYTDSASVKAHAKVQLASDKLMPSIGFGTAGLGDATYQAVLDAISVGYRLIDSAQAREWYREDLVGQALKAADIQRSELFLTSKLHPRDLHQAAQKVEQTLSDLGTQYLDLFLLHYPRCWESLCGPPGENEGTWQDAWRQLETLVHAGKIRALGVSNFGLAELSELVKFAKIKPSIVQVRSDPLSSSRYIQTFCKLAGIQFQAYSSLGTQWGMQGHGQNKVLEDPDILEVAQKLDCSPAQIVLRWALQHGQAVVPRSRSKVHMAENLAVIKQCALSDSDVRQIDVLDHL